MKWNDNREKKKSFWNKQIRRKQINLKFKTQSAKLNFNFVVNVFFFFSLSLCSVLFHTIFYLISFQFYLFFIQSFSIICFFFLRNLFLFYYYCFEGQNRFAKYTFIQLGDRFGIIFFFINSLHTLRFIFLRFPNILIRKLLFRFYWKLSLII